MGLESTIVCVDNSEFSRNGDYVPTRLQAQEDAVNTICRFKLRSNPENDVGLITLSKGSQVVSSLTSDVGKLMTHLHKLQAGGEMNLLVGLRIAHLALKQRVSRNHRMRIVAFVGSPITQTEKECQKVGSKLKKECVSLVVVNFGEIESNKPKLEALVAAINSKDNESHLVTVPTPCSNLSDALLTSPIMASEDGSTTAAQASGSYEFGVDPNEDPELALALRVSMEEQRQRTEAPVPEEAAPMEEAQPQAQAAGGSEEAMLQQALAMSLGAEATPAPGAAPPAPDFSSMTEEEQIAYAMQISMQECEPMEVETKTEAMEEESSDKKEQQE